MVHGSDLFTALAEVRDGAVQCFASRHYQHAMRQGAAIRACTTAQATVHVNHCKIINRCTPHSCGSHSLPAVLRCGCQATAVTLDGVRREGDCVRRSFGWADSMASNSWDYRGQVSGFLSSFSWSCTNIANGNECAGNLEQLHNNVHNTIGGDMATLSTAGWDPLFWWVAACYHVT